MTRGARWIWWFDGDPPEPPWEQTAPRAFEPESWVLLRRSFTLEVVPDGARCRVTADGRYVLWVNGVELGRGPARSEPSHLTCDAYDLPLRAGPNAVAILARHYGRPAPWWKPAPFVGQLGHGGVLFEGDVVASDGSWRAARAPYLVSNVVPSDGPPDPEVVEPGKFPLGWTAPAFDDSGWDPVVVLDASMLGARAEPPGEPFGPLGDRPIPMLHETVLDLGSSRDLAEDEGFVVDAGGIVNAHIVVRSEDAAVLELTCGEDLAHDGSVIAEPRDWGMTVIGHGEIRAFEAVGFRYVSARATGGPARGVRLSAVERLYPREPGATFRCSDPVLNDIWDAGLRTLDLCATDAYLDCPGREQRAWLSDSYLHTLLTLITNPDTRLVARMLRLHAQGARADGFLPPVGAGDYGMRAMTLPDSSLLWVLALARAFEYTADLPLVTELLPTAARILDAFERWRDDDGLITDLPGWIFIDWAQLERGPKQAAVDALYAMALDAHADLCDAAGDAGSAGRSRARAERTREAFEAYWDPACACYVDTAGGTRVSQQTNAVAILSGAASRDRWDGIFARVIDPARTKVTRTPGDPGTFAERIGSQFRRPDTFDDATDVVACQPFFAHFLHQALARAGRYEDLLASIRRWAPMLERGDGCFGEYWSAEPGLGSRCHAFSATPTYDLTTHILGVHPLEPGRVVAGERHLAGLEWAEGTVATRDGWLSVVRGRPATKLG
jgi:hypothetical protein